LQLQLLAATVTDPGYRPEAEELFRQNMTNYFARLRATPGAALANTMGGILSDNDPRFTLQPAPDYQHLSFARLKAAIGDRLAKGAIEIAIVGDVDEARTIALVGATFGALPPREPEFRPYDEARARSFTAQRGLRVVRHTGAPNQALVRIVWPTTDDSDPRATMAMELVQEVAGVEVLDNVRERLGKSYSPGAQSSMSRVWRGWGTFALQASVDVADVAATRAALMDTVRDLAARPVEPDILQRARAPMLERIDNMLKTNGGWMALAERAQSQPDRLARALSARQRLSALTPADVQAMAKRYLAPGNAVEIVVVPEAAEVPRR